MMHKGERSWRRIGEGIVLGQILLIFFFTNKIIRSSSNKGTSKRHLCKRHW